MPAPLILAQPRAVRLLQSNVCTRYEAALIGPDGAPAAILAYDAKRTKRALLHIMLEHGPRVVAMSAMPDDQDAEWRGGAWHIGSTGWRVGWTGHTEYERACNGALGEGVAG